MTMEKMLMKFFVFRSQEYNAIRYNLIHCLIMYLCITDARILFLSLGKNSNDNVVAREHYVKFSRESMRMWKVDVYQTLNSIMQNREIFIFFCISKKKFHKSVWFSYHYCLYTPPSSPNKWCCKLSQGYF